MSKKVLVTGGSGKAGSYVVRELVAAGYEVTNLDQRRLEGLPGAFIKVDLCNAGEVYDAFAQVKPDFVCHVAANPAPSGDPRQTVFANNTLSTYHVLQAAGDFGVKRLVYASSEMATGWLTTTQLPPRLPFAEEDRATTPNAYALSKYLGEVISDSLSVRYPEMPIVSLRINNVITPETYTWLADRRANYPHGGSGNFWSYIDVRDVATAFRCAIEADTTGHEVFLIAAADTCLDTPLHNALQDHYGNEALALLAEGHGEFQSVFNCSKAERVLGWKAAHSWRDA
ncbi:NAD-dependent epimerase/dehydratase family protein [Armatimonas rosea]|uniref:Nucleoside-diphosphate-sugar epimerase n=1 Tax=Armatimonas rosea TaxID=685828 RepID=A0A7W9W739_ARMRO|nr:NAD(P)-dependent oxidoreductase [Armatimonas rosea]MBB6050700.1 nucleoside-diphosphate-sugar epimerase [Armatimonas rosea]